MRHVPAPAVERTMEVDQDLRVHDETGGEIDRAADAVRDVIGEEAAHLVAEGDIVGLQQQIQGTSPNSSFFQFTGASSSPWAATCGSAMMAPSRRRCSRVGRKRSSWAIRSFDEAT